MASSPRPQLATTITCPTCDFAVTQQPGTRRTICPKCGNFYSAQAAHDVRFNPNRNRRAEARLSNRKDTDKLPDIKNDREKGGLSKIANFFQKLGSNKKSKTSTEGTELQELKSSSAAKTELPRISPSSQGRLTVDNRSGDSRSNSSRSERSAREVRLRTISSASKLQAEVSQGHASGNWQAVSDYYATTFENFAEINSAFKRDAHAVSKSIENSGVNLNFVYVTYDLLDELPQDIQKIVLKAIINSLLRDKRPHTKDDLRAYLILLQNPQFNNYATYVIFAHLLRQTAALSDHDHHYLVHWFKTLPNTKIEHLIKKLHSFISCRLFPPKPQDLPPMSKCSWWIPSATKVMALLNAANNLCSPHLVQYLEFYNSTLDHLDMMAEYYAWQNPSTHPGFTFCQYPFILSITAKRAILQRDSEQQMIIMARRSLVAKVQRRQIPDIGMLFLNLNVRRSHLVPDSLNEVSSKQHDLKKKLKVTFIGEPGLDMGGLTKEWFLLLIKQIFKPEYGMFTYDKEAQVFWFSTAPQESYQEFNLVGVLMGLAVYNSINLDIRFPAICYKKLLSPAVVPYNNPNAPVGVTTVQLSDLGKTMPVLAKSLKDVLEYEGDLEEDLCMTYQVSYSEFGQTKTHVLKPNGQNIPVTDQNKEDFVRMYSDWILNKSIHNQFQAFYHGFHTVCASNALIMLRPEEVETLVCGSSEFDFDELRKVTVYDGYSANDPAIRTFWDVTLNMSKELQKRFLSFCTGSDRIPVGGMKEMLFKITRVEGSDMLPMSHTCFNQLVLPNYKSKKSLKQKLYIAIQNAEGFGIE